MSHNPYITQPGNKKSPVAAATYGTTSSATNPAPYGSAGGSSGYASASSTPSGNSYVNGPLTSETTSYPSSSSYGGTTSTSSNAYRSTIAPTLSYGNNDYRSHTSTLASSAAAAGSSNVYGNSPSLSSPTSTSAYTFAAPQSSVLFSKALEVSSPSLERQTKAAAVTALSSAHLSSLRSSSNNRQQEQQYGQENNVLPSMEYPAKNEGTRISLTNSVTYQDGRTTGLISEGSPVKCHKIDYEIKGHDMQLVEIELDPAESVIGEAGAMMFMEDEIKFEAKFGDGAEPKQGFFKKLMAAGGRLMTGESLFITHFTNESQTCKARVAFAAPYPGTIAPVNLANLPGQTITCQRDAFLCAAYGTKLSMTFNKRIGSGLFGGEGFILEKLEGDGMAFLHAGGTIIRRELNNERVRLDTGCLVAFTQGISFEIMMVPGLKTMFFGGEGLFLAVLKGTGTIWMQSLPFSRMADRIIKAAPSAGGKRIGEGSRLTGSIGDLVDGDGFGGFKMF